MNARQGDLVRMPEVRELTPELLDDYLRFFDHDAFSDNPDWAPCYCRFFHFGGTPEEFERASAAENRAAISDMIRAGTAHGYLAYVDGRPVGWCNAAPRTELPHLTNWGPFETADPERVGSVICFVIAPAFRRQGIARQLLDAACAGFARRGLAVAEAYPTTKADSDAHAYHGPESMYRAAGFEPVRAADDFLIMRKSLSPAFT